MTVRREMGFKRRNIKGFMAGQVRKDELLSSMAGRSVIAVPAPKPTCGQETIFKTDIPAGLHGTHSHAVSTRKERAPSSSGWRRPYVGVQSSAGRRNSVARVARRNQSKDSNVRVKKAGSAV